MNIELSHPGGEIKGDLQITGSKSESNRALILQALFPAIKLENLSNSDDTAVMKKALATGEETVDIHHAGTAMRFLTAYFAARKGREVVLTGSSRMQERPVQILVDALRELGAEIAYVSREGYPPIKIVGKEILRKKVSVEANISSQYISALILIAPALESGLEIELKGKITSTPYITMTLEILSYFGIEAEFNAQTITIEPANNLKEKTLHIESDWSSASYFYSIVALSTGAKISLTNYRKSSLQGDSELVTIYEKLGVSTSFQENKILLEKIKKEIPQNLELDLQNTPDLAQTIAVTCLGLGIGCELSGLHTLKIKETDRLLALKSEMEKLGAQVEVTNDSLVLQPSKGLKNNVSIATYNDHRMAMAFAPLALLVPVEIEDAGVVSKSYPDFWNHLEKLGFKTSAPAKP